RYFQGSGVLHQSSPLGFVVSTFHLPGFQLIKQRVEALEVALPDLPVTLQPAASFRERLAFDPAWPSLCLAAARNQARALQYLEVLGNRGLAHGERPGQVGHRSVAACEPRQDRSPGWVGEGPERCIEAGGKLHWITHRL